MARKSCIINDSTPRPRAMFLPILGSRRISMLCRNSFRKFLCWNELHIELGGLFFEPAHLGFAVLALVVFHALIEVCDAVAQQTIDEPGQVMSHGGDGFGGAQASTQAAVLGTQIALAAM